VPCAGYDCCTGREAQKLAAGADVGGDNARVELPEEEDDDIEEEDRFAVIVLGAADEVG
jgi:hypothetical protein